MFTHELLGQEPPSDETYEERAARFEAEARAAWNSFYVAVAVIVILCAVFAAHSVLDSAPPERVANLNKGSA